MSRATPGAPIEVEGLTKTFASSGAPVVAVDEVSMSVETGSLTAVVGPSGSGKSTLLQLLAGLERPDRGSVRIGGTELTRLRDRALSKLRRDRIGFIFQAYQLLPQLTAEQNISLPLRLSGRAVDPADLAELAGMLGIDDRLQHLPAQLSGGQQQRVAIARALITRPAVVLADEPTGALDSSTAADLIDLFVRASRERRQTFVIVTHDERVSARADQVLRMADGRISTSSPLSGCT